MWGGRIFTIGMIGLTVALGLGKRAHASPESEVKQITPVAVRVSSVLPPWKGFTFDGSNLIDGRDDTSWQPAKSKMLGVGQWIEIDLGATYRIDRIEISQGLQATDPVLGDLFCRNNRMRSANILFEDGTFSSLFDMGSDRVLTEKTAYSNFLEPDENRKAVARRFLIVVDSVLEPVDWKDMAVGEVRVFGSPVNTPATKTASLCHTSTGYAFRKAVVEYCGRLSLEARGAAYCNGLMSTMVRCQASTGWMPKEATETRPLPEISAEQVVAGKVAWEFPFDGAKVSLHFQMKGSKGWVLTELKRASWDGSPVLSQPELIVDLDTEKTNKCWEKLKKKRPVREEEPMYDSD